MSLFYMLHVLLPWIIRGEYVIHTESKGVHHTSVRTDEVSEQSHVSETEGSLSLVTLWMMILSDTTTVLPFSTSVVIMRSF